MDKLKVLLTTEGTYPFHQGGVSTWCDTLVQKLKDVDFTVYSVMMDPFINQKFQLPENTELIKMPLWGTEEPSEHLKTPFSLVYLKKKRTTNKAVRERFLPLFTKLVHHILAEKKAPRQFGYVLFELHKYFREYEYKVSFKSELTWETYKTIVSNDYIDDLPEPDVFGLIQSLGWVYRFLNILNTQVPKAHVSHSSAAAFCGIPCVLAKIEHNVPFLLTEHGIYLREQYLSLSKRKLSPFLNSFLVRMIHSITQLNYYFADQVSPVCHYNTRWETVFGVQQNKIDVIYNGVDKKVFNNEDHPQNVNPTVVTVARIDPIKDIITLLKSAAIVKKEIPNVKYIVYGSVSVQEYYNECLEMRQQLELEDTFIFSGHTTNMLQAYQSGDVVALSSISEAFPYSVVEAMMVGKPVVATDVGGIKEAIGETGIIVQPYNAEKMAEGITRLLKDRRLRAYMGEESRTRALSYFTQEQILDSYMKVYLKLSFKILPQETSQHVMMLPEKATKTSQKDFAEKGYALVAIESYVRAIDMFKQAIKVEPDAPAVPLYLSEIAKAYNALGQYDKAMNEIEKVKSLLYLKEQIEEHTIA